jgi:ATP:ADP antiporter, AAA family
MINPFPGVRLYNRRELFLLIITSFQAVLLGAFIAFFSIGSHVLFLQSWKPDQLPQAFVLSGIFGIALFSFYGYLSSRVNFRTLALVLLVIVAIACTALYVFHDVMINLNVFGIPLMLPFTVCLPVVFLMSLLFRRLTLDAFSNSQHRRFNPLVRTLFVVGIVGASYTLVLALYINWDILLIIAVSAATMIVACFTQLIMNLYRKNLKGHLLSQKKITPLRSKFYELFYTRYTILLLAFVILSSVVGFLIHYHFVSETRLNYPDTIGLAKFFGFFTGTMFLFIWGVERILLRKILYAYDSPYSLVLIPVVLLLAAVASLVVDLLVGQSNAFARFSFGFLMVAMLKIGYETTFEAVELPTLRVLYRTLDLRFLNSVKPRLEGTFRMVSLIIAGFMIAGLLWVSLNRSLFINLLILVLTIFWIPIGITLVKSYQNALREYIRRLKSSKRTIGQDTLTIDEKTHYLINSNDPAKSVNTLSIIERLEPLTHEKHMVSLLKTESVDLQKYLLERIDENALFSFLPNLKEIQNSDQARLQNGYLTKLISRFEIKINTAVTKRAVENLVNSHTLTDRILAAEIIGNLGNMDYSDFLLQLSRDFEPEVKLASVKAMARLGSPNHSHVLIGYLTTPVYYPYAFEALVKIGDPAMPFMEECFLLPEVEDTVLLRIVRIYGKIGTQTAIDSLLSKIENQNRTISRQALLALREAKFQSSPGNINRILNDIVRLINIMSWNFGAFASIKNNAHFDLLREALNAEINDNYDTLYHLLSLAYNSTSIGNIKLLLEGGNDTDISFAIEMLDQIVNEEIKQVFFPVVENIPVKERFKQLQYFFQGIKETPETLIQEIITRDFNQISLYVKACAMNSMLQFNPKEAGQVVIASMFHPNQLISESAAYVLNAIDSSQLDTVFERLSRERVNELKITLSRIGEGIPYLLLDRIRFIKNCHLLRNISEDILFEISRAMVIHQMKVNEEFLVKREDVHFAFIIIIDGTAQINISSGKVFTFEKNDIIYSDILVEDSTYSLKALTDLRFYSLEQEMLNTLMFDFIDFRNAILKVVEEA